MKKTYFSAVVIGTVVEKKIAKAFEGKCKPYKTDDVIEAFINSVVDGDLKINMVSNVAIQGADSAKRRVIRDEL